MRLIFFQPYGYISDGEWVILEHGVNFLNTSQNIVWKDRSQHDLLVSSGTLYLNSIHHGVNTILWGSLSQIWACFVNTVKLTQHQRVRDRRTDRQTDRHARNCYNSKRQKIDYISSYAELFNATLRSAPRMSAHAYDLVFYIRTWEKKTSWSQLFFFVLNVYN